VKKSNRTGATEWDATANADDTYAGDTRPCPCGCGGELHRDLSAFIRFFAPFVAEEMRERFVAGVVDPQVRHLHADDDSAAWMGCGRTNNRAQRSDDNPATPVPFFPVTNGDPDAVRRDAARRAGDLRWRGFAR
jgi:hypothetical protein